MAYETIYRETIYEWNQEERISEDSTRLQDAIDIKAELVVQQDRDVIKNRSSFLAELLVTIAADPNGKGLTYTSNVSYGYSDYDSYLLISRGSSIAYLSDQPNIDGREYKIAPGETRTFHLRSFESSDTDTYIGGRGKTSLKGAHKLNGEFGVLYGTPRSSQYEFYLNFEGRFYFSTKANGETNSVIHNYSFNRDITNYALPIDRAMYPTTADNFTDEDNPVITYAAIPGYNYVIDDDEAHSAEDTITALQAALSFDGVSADIPYRDIAIKGASYVFELTDKEREILRVKAQGSDIVPIYYLTKITRHVAAYDEPEETLTFTGATKRSLTIVGCNPTLNPTVKDIKPETLALTGDENTFVRYESMAEYAINATASKNATIVNQSVQCGSKIISNLPYGVIDDTESGTFIFNVTDSRNMGASSSVFKGLVEYVKPTCYQKLEVEISGETGANIKVKVNGNYFNGSFGAADNTLKLEVRHTDGNGNMGAWKTLSGTPTYNGNTYELETILTGFNYGKGYVFQCRATDKLNVVESSQYTIKMLPVFDWSESDFNFNVPINIEAEDLSMHGETIIRHSNDTNNTVLSASSGNIYIRPGGTNSTSGETIFYGDGSVKFNGSVTFADGSTAGGDKEYVDYVIATGEEAMGTNGTWYWRKWESGKAEAWGCRNFGNMAVNTAWGNLYRSAIFTQDLPSNVFARTPDSININIVHAGYGGWICKHEQTAPSANTTGSFIFVRPASATVTPTNLGFHIIGEWK